MADHLRLDFHLVEFLARVDADHAANHLGHDDHVAQMRLYQVGLLVRLGFLLGFPQLLDKPEWAALQTAVEPAPGSCVDDIAELLGGEVEKSDGKRSATCILEMLMNYFKVQLDPPKLPITVDQDVLVKVDASVGKLSKGSFSLQLCITV